MKYKFLSFLIFFTMLISCSSNEDTEKDIVKEPDPVLVDKEITITSITPLSGKKDAPITIKGANFGTNISAVEIYFGDKKAIIQSIKDDEIIVLVPNKVLIGTIKIIKDKKELINNNFDYIPTATVSYVRRWSPINPSTQLYANQIAIDKLGNIYMTLAYTNPIDKLSFTGEYFDTIAEFPSYAAAITTDSNNNIFVADNSGFLYKITPLGEMTRVFDKNGDRVRFSSSTGMCFDSKNNLFIAEFSSNRILKFSSEGILSIYAEGGLGSVDGNVKVAKFREPSGIVADEEDNLYISEYKNNRIRKISPEGIVTTLAGSGVSGRKDGKGSEAQFNGPRGITIDKNKNLYITDSDNNAIRMLTPKGNVFTIAGSSAGYKNGVGTEAEFLFPRGIAMNPNGILFVGDNGNGELRKIVIE